MRLLCLFQLRNAADARFSRAGMMFSKDNQCVSAQTLHPLPIGNICATKRLKGNGNEYFPPMEYRF